MPQNTAEGFTVNDTVPTVANTGGDSGTAASLVAISTGDSINATNSKFSHGQWSYRMDWASNGTGATRLMWNINSAGRVVLSFYIWLDSLPTQLEDLAGFRNATGNITILQVGTDGKVFLSNGGSTVSRSTDTIPTGQWVRFDFSCARGTTTSNGTAGYAYYTQYSNTPIYTWEASDLNTGTTDIVSLFVGRSTGRLEGRTVWYDSIRYDELPTGWMSSFSRDLGWYIVSNGVEIKVTFGTTSEIRPYFNAADWLWNPIVANPALDSNSAAIATALANGQHSCAIEAFGVTVKGPEGITASTPRYDIVFANVYDPVTNPMGWGPDPNGSDTVPIPAGTRLSPVPIAENGDSHYAVADPTTNKVYDLWQADFSQATKTASWGGWSILDGDGRSVSGGSTGCGISRLAAVITEAEIAAGEIKHALFFGSDMVRPTEFRYPAKATDGSNLINSPVTIPEGARVQLDPSINLDAIPGISPAELAIGKALQIYGAYCGDNGGARMGFIFELPQNINSTVYADNGIEWDYYNMQSIPWSSLRVLAAWDGSGPEAPVADNNYDTATYDTSVYG